MRPKFAPEMIAHACPPGAIGCRGWKSIPVIAVIVGVGSPTVNGRKVNNPFSEIVWFGVSEIVGVWLPATVRMNVSLALDAPSLTVTVMVALPLWFDAAVTVTLRLAPDPAKVMFPFGTSVGLEELPDTVNNASLADRRVE